MTIYFASFYDFLAMNGYARFVWPAVALVLGVLVVAAWYGRYERRAVLADIRRQQRRREALDKRSATDTDDSAGGARS